MSRNYLINSIYRATEGEGIQLGTPQVFVRFQGCAIGCINCDSMDTWAFEGEKMALIDVWDKIWSESLEGKIKRVSITGGDPLHPSHEPQVLELVKYLRERGWYINIEAAGTRVVDSIFDNIDFISFDFKTPSTGVKTRIQNLVKLISQYPNKYQIKSVIADKVDFDATVEAYNSVMAQLDLESTQPVPWVLTPCYETHEDFPMERFTQVQDMNISAGSMFRVIGQQHKWIYGAEKKHV
ncbi:MAG: 7-carboxy-7-deazaguanine synthase QueE [Bdellovibrionota bacterium]|nr:7-carboxy-7-deazaguanine synthase QueE [Bdellovibrionota bacterium]